MLWGFPGGSAGKESACNAGDPGSIPGLGSSPGEGIGYPLQYSWSSLVAQTVKIRPQWGRPGFNPWVGKIPWRRAWQPTPVFLPGESPWTEEPGGLQPMEPQWVGYNWATKQAQPSKGSYWSRSRWKVSGNENKHFQGSFYGPNTILNPPSWF